MGAQPPRARGPLRQAPLARHGQLRQSGPWATALKWIASALAVVLVSGASIAAVAVWNVAKDVKPGVALIGEKAGPPPAIGSYDGGFN
ncbi:MAG: LytR family transcriptional regulator, partial [Lacisediminihabitans sp.]